jgi:hypothetical protein
MKFDIWEFFENLSRKFKFCYNLTWITGTSHEDVCKFVISQWIVLGIRNFSDKRCGGNQNTRFIFSSLFFFRKSCRLWGNMEKYGRVGQATDGNIIGGMRFACRIAKARIRHTLVIFNNTYRFSTATMVTRTRVGVRFPTYFDTVVNTVSVRMILSWCV